MSRLKDRMWQAALFISFALLLTGTCEANARGGGGHGGGGGGHSSGGHSSSRTFSGGGGSGHILTSANLNEPSPRVHTSSYRGGRRYGGGRGGYGGYNNYYGSPQDSGQQPGPVNGQVFSGSSHIAPSEYGRYVQSYQWPSAHQ